MANRKLNMNEVYHHLDNAQMEQDDLDNDALYDEYDDMFKNDHDPKMMTEESRQKAKWDKEDEIERQNSVHASYGDLSWYDHPLIYSIPGDELSSNSAPPWASNRVGSDMSDVAESNTSRLGYERGGVSLGDLLRRSKQF